VLTVWLWQWVSSPSVHAWHTSVMSWMVSAFSWHYLKLLVILVCLKMCLDTNNPFMDGCYKSGISGRSLPKFNYMILLFYCHMTLQGLRHVFHVEFCSSMLLFFLVTFWCFYCVLGEYHVLLYLSFRASYIYNKPTRCDSGSIVFMKNYKYALHVSDALCVHLQEHYKL